MEIINKSHVEIYMVLYCLLTEKLFVKRESCFDFDVSIKSERRALVVAIKDSKRLNKKSTAKHMDLFTSHVVSLHM